MTRFRQITGGRLPLDRIRRVLLIQLGDIGDVVLSLPSIDAVVCTIPQVDLSVLVRRKAAGLLADHPAITRCLTPDGPAGEAPRSGMAAQWSFLRSIRRPRFDLAIDLRCGTRGAFAALLSGAPHRASLHANNEVWWRNRLFTHLVYVPYALTTHVAEHYLNPLRGLGFQDGGSIPRLPVPDTRRRQVERLLNDLGISDRPIIAMQPVSLWQYKELPEDSYVTIARETAAATGGHVILVGGPAEVPALDRIARQAGGKVTNLAGKSPLDLLPAILAICDRFVGIDSAGLHVAAAVGTPSVGIFGPSAVDSWMPRGDAHRAVTATMDCIPCRRKGCDDSGQSKCLVQLDPHRVVAAACEGLVRSGRGGDR